MVPIILVRIFQWFTIQFTLPFGLESSCKMIRREVRLRKEFLFKREIDAQNATKVDKKRKLKEAIDQGKSIPTELVSESRQLYHESELDIAKSTSNLDDEYANAGSREPKVCVTTSRDPGSRLKQFAK